MPTNVTAERLEEIAAEIGKFSADVNGAKDLAKAANDNLATLRTEIDSMKESDKNDPVAQEKIDNLATLVEGLEAKLNGANDNIEELRAVNKRPGATGGGWGNEDEAKQAKEAFAFHRARLANSGDLRVDSKIEPDSEEYAAYQEAFVPYMRARSDNALKPNFMAAMQTGSDPDGGYLVPVTTSDRMVKRVYETSALRRIATVETIGGKELIIPRDEGEFGHGGWVGETTAPSETNTSQLGESKITAHEMFAEPRVTQNMLEDAGLDIEAWVANKVGDKFGRVEATAFFTGTGSNQPRGLLTYANWTTPGSTENGKVEQIVSGNATEVTADSLYDLVFALKDPYTANSRFLAKRTTVRDLLKMKDGEGRYLWQMGDIRGGVPSTLLGYEVERAEDMPAVSAGNLALAFGDFAQAYTIVDRLGITLLRDNLTAKPYVKFYNRRRVGGDVVNFEAYKLLKIAAS